MSDYLDNSNFDSTQGLNFSSLKSAGNSLGYSGIDTQVDTQSGNWGNWSNLGGMSDSQIAAGLSGGTSDSSTLSKLLFGSKDSNENVTAGYANTGLNLLKSGLTFYLGSQQLSQAEDALSENKRQFNLNYDAQKAIVNDQLAWQYQARKDRNAANAGTLTQIA